MPPKGLESMRRYILAILIIIASAISGTDAEAARRKKQPVDTVGLQCRGVMETFQKVTDDLENRLDFYAANGYTHYFYCPSDDRYCNRWGWKFLYNDSDRHLVRQLNAMCKTKGIDFVWTVSPGERYKWNEDDYKFLLDKLVMMYYNGIRSFAVHFAENQGDYISVRDSLMRDFVDVRPEEVSLFMIDDMSVAEYPSDGVSAVQSMMRGYHFDETFVASAKKNSGVICNISSADEFAKLAVLSVADFARNPSGYSADESMADAVEALHGDVKDAFITFLKHTGEVQESAGVTTFSLNDWTKEKSDKLAQEFAAIEAVPELIRSNSSSILMKELDAWLVEFGRLGTRGQNVIRCMDYYMTGNLEAFWLTYLSTVMTEDQIVSYEQHPVGAGKLHPFCIEAMEAMKEGFASMLTGKTVLHNLASTLYSRPNAALDSDFTTSMHSNGHVEFAIPAEANTCHLLTGELPEDERIIFRQLRTDGSLVAEFILKSPYTSFDLKEGAVKVDILGDVQVYENIFVYL